MIQVTNTPALTGVTISGEYDDLNALVDAIYEVTISDYDEGLNKTTARYLNISLHVLGLAYDIRHAAQGDRDLTTRPNGLQEWHAEAFGAALPATTVLYSVNVFYPQVILVTMALNDLVKLRMRRLAKTRYDFEVPFDKTVITDRTIAVIRLFQSGLMSAIGEVLTKASLTRWLNIVYDRATDVTGITHPFIDTWNLRYLAMSRETRVKKLLTVTRRFAAYRTDKENIEFRRAVDQAVVEYRCDESDLRFPHLQYPDEIEW